MPSRTASAQFARFLAVGIVNTLLSLVVFSALSSVSPTAVAGAFAFTAGAVSGYLLNASWTFAARGSWRRYLAVQLAGLGATSAVAGIGGTLGYLAALPLVTLSTFTASRRWAFPRTAP